MGQAASLAATSGLAYWKARLAAEDGRITDALMAEMASRPGFVTASYAQLAGSLAMNSTNPMAARVANDLTRLFLGFIALYLDAQGGLTRTAIREMIARLNLASPGRSAAVLMQMRLYKLIEPDPYQPDRRTRRYIPTAMMKQAFTELILMGMNATAHVEPDVASLAEHFTDPLFVQGYAIALGESTIMMLRNLRDAERDMFADATAGYQLLYRLMDGTSDRQHYPPRGALPFDRSALSRELKVSRSHVSRLFNTAAGRGLVVFGNDRATLRFSEPFVEHLVKSHAATFLNNIRCYLRALDYVRQMRLEVA